MGYAEDINVLARSRMAVNEVHTVWENEAITLGLNIITKKKTKATDWNWETKEKKNLFKKFLKQLIALHTWDQLYTQIMTKQ
jgi:hypothetical protein